MHPYPDTRESSGELLRIVLSMLSKHPAGFTPISYAIRYEHAQAQTSMGSTWPRAWAAKNSWCFCPTRPLMARANTPGHYVRQLPPDASLIRH